MSAHEGHWASRELPALKEFMFLLGVQRLHKETSASVMCRVRDSKGSQLDEIYLDFKGKVQLKQEKEKKET